LWHRIGDDEGQPQKDRESLKGEEEGDTLVGCGRAEWRKGDIGSTIVCPWNSPPEGA
jgi:hypothetical protein